MTSLKPPHPVVIDGNADDWTGTLSYVAKDQLFVGFVNDRESLSICLTREEGGGPAAGRMGGWTVWFDPAGGTRKTYGLRVVPLGAPQDRRRPAQEPEEPEQGGEGPASEPGSEIQWLGPGGDVLRRFTPDDAAKLGLEVREGRTGGAYVLEIRVPLEASASHPLAIGAGADAVVGVGFFSERAGRNGGPGGLGGGAGRPGVAGGIPGGMSGGAVGGARGGWRGAMEPNLEPDVAKAVKVWTRVRLSASNRPEPSTLLNLISE